MDYSNAPPVLTSTPTPAGAGGRAATGLKVATGPALRGHPGRD
ncbi:MAG: hypothetical protein WKG07_04575 [Hymenobacter sp.]